MPGSVGRLALAGAVSLICAVALLAAGCGRDEPPLTADPEQIEFGDQELGQRSAAQTVTVRNTSRDDVTLARIAFEGPNNKQFVLADVGGCAEGMTLERDTSCRLGV